jgi:hypothetical protein
MSHLFTNLAADGRGWVGDAPNGAMLVSMRGFLTAAAENPEVVREAASLLGAEEPGSAAWIAIGFGTLVERGTPAELSGEAVLDRVIALLPLLPMPPGSEEEDPPEPTAEQTTLLALFRYLCQSAVTHLARLPALRERLGRDAALLERLQDLSGYSPGAWWVHEALTKTSGTLLLLHPSSGTGMRLRYANVSNCFHLFSLVQTAVGTSIPGGRTPDEAIARVARGKSAESVDDEAWWHYGSATSPKADLKTSIWGEGLVREIPIVAAERIMLLWPPLLQGRSWTAGFLGPHLDAMPADVTVDSTLTPEECASWIARLGISNAPKKPWWRFW